MGNPSRALILRVAGNAGVRRTITRYGMRLGASRFVAGENLATALQAVADLNRQHILVTLDHLGEQVTDPQQARQSAAACLEALDALADQRLQGNLSVKLTQLGLDVDPALCRENMQRIVGRARDCGNFVRVDMEDSRHTDATLALVRDLAAEFGSQHVGTVLQAYLYRTAADLEALIAAGVPVRLVKGAYLEPATLAYPKKADVDANFQQRINRALAAGLRTAVATHDVAIIAATRQFAASQGIAPERFEFQMLYGIRRDLQHELAQAGYKVRVYVPYGGDWYGYFTRRLAERPANVGFVLANLLRP